MKKFLSMVLAMVMTLSLVTVSAGAREFPDSDELTGDSDGVYAEAVNVLSEMGIIDGDTDGNFKPKGTLTRGAASKIIACMMLGKTTAESLGTAAAPFKDVPVGSTFAGYIAYCVEQGIIDGYADGTFRPSGALTGYAFQKMLLTALGYDSKIEGYANNPNWRVNVAGRAQQEGILTGLDLSSYSAAEAATREQACLMALNTIKTPLVEYESKGSTITVNGATVSQAASSAKYVTTVDRSHATSIDDKVYQTSATGTSNSYFVEFGEQYQTDLRRIRLEDGDDFGRPAYTWTWQKDEVGTYVDYSLLIAEYNTGVSGRALREVIGQSAIDESGLTYWVDGVEFNDAENAATQYIDHVVLRGITKDTLVRGNDTDAGMTKNGVLTQVFLDRDHGDKGKDWTLTITSIDTWLAKANADYNSTAEELSLTAYTSKKVNDGGTGTMNLKVDVEDVPAVESVKKDDFILIQRSGKESTGTRPTLRVVDIKDVEILSDATVTQFSKGGKQENEYDDARAIDKLTTGGTEYNFSQKCFYDAEALDEYDHSLLTNMTYDVYLDEHGYVIGVTVHEGNRNYVFITAYDTPTSAIINRNATATAIFLDGSIQDITVNTKDTDTNIDRVRVTNGSNQSNYFTKWSQNKVAQHNRWYTYTVNSAGVYTLKPAERMLVDDYKRVDNSTDGLTLNSANLQLRATETLKNDTTNTVGTSKTTANVTRAYGNDNSVYITVGTDKVTPYNNNTQVDTIDDVIGLYTGAQNVKLDLNKNEKTGIPEYIYALYDSDNYIIAAIVVGEAQGSISNYAYIYSNTKSERYDSSDGYYYWTFEGIQNGEFKTFTARSKFSDTMNQLVPYHMMQLLFEGDYVSRVKAIGEDDREYTSSTGAKATGNTKFWVNNFEELTETNIYTGRKPEDDVDVFDVGHVNDRNVMEACKHPLVGYPGTTNSGRINGTLTLEGNTLFVDYGNNGGMDKGLAIRSGAKAVVIQNFNGDRHYSEHSSVRDAIDSMRDADDQATGMQFKGRIVAPLSDGVAQWVILISDTPLKTGDRTGSTSGSGSTVVRPSGSITINGPQSTSTTANFTGRGTLTADSVSVTLDSNHDLRISFTKSASDAYSSGTAEITVNNRVITVPLTKNAAGQLEGRTSGEAINITDSISVDITRAVATSTTDDTNVPSGNIVSKPSTVESISVQKGSVISAEDVKVEIPSTGTNADKVIVTVPTGNLPTGTKVGDTFELTVEDENGNKETVSATVTASGLSFTSTRSFASAKNVKLSVAKKTETPLPTGQVQVTSSVTGVTGTAKFVGDDLVVTIPATKPASNNDAKYGFTIRVDGVKQNPTVKDASWDGNNWVVIYSGLQASLSDKTVVNIDEFVADTNSAANEAAAANAKQTGVEVVASGENWFKELTETYGGDLSKPWISEKVTIKEVTEPTAEKNAYTVVLTGKQAIGVSYNPAIAGDPSLNEATECLVVPVKFIAPANAAQVVIGESTDADYNVGDTVTSASGDEVLDEVKAADIASGYNFFAFLRAKSTTTTGKNQYNSMNVKLTWLDSDGKVIADTISYVIDPADVEVISNDAAIDEAKVTGVTPITSAIAAQLPAGTNYAQGLSVAASDDKATGQVRLTVTGSYTKNSGIDFNTTWGFGTARKGDSYMVVPLVMAAPDGATAVTTGGTARQNLDKDRASLMGVLVPLTSDAVSEMTGANDPAFTTNNTKLMSRTVKVRWHFGDSDSAGTEVEYVIDCTGVTVSNSSAS